MRRRAALRALVAAALLVVVALPPAGAGHQVDDSYTGCLFVSGRSKGKVNKLDDENAPLSPCGTNQVEIHLSGGDLTDVVAGTGLDGGGDSGDVTLDLLEGFQLPQGCATGEIPERSGGGWACSTDDFAIDGSQSARLVSRLGFSRTTVDASADDVGQFVSATIGTDGLPVMTYWDATDSSIRFAHCGNPSCTSGNTIETVPVTAVPFGMTALAIGADGLPLIAYRSGSVELRVAHCSNALCSAVDADTALDVGGLYPSITTGTDGFPIVSHVDLSVGELRIVHCADVTCSTPDTPQTVDTTGASAIYTSIAIGGDGLPVVSYVFNTTDLRVAHCDSVDCTTHSFETVDSASIVNFGTSIAVGTDGLPVVSYYDGTGSDLKVAHCGDATCSASNTLSTVDTAGVGLFSSIAIGRDGLPVISHRDGIAPGLKVSHCGNVLCSVGNTSTTVHSTGNPEYMSITIGTDGLPLIAHYDAGDDDLGAVHCSSVSCVPFQVRR